MAGPPARLARGDLLPRVLAAPPGPASRHAARLLARCEAPGINTLSGGAAPIVWREARGANVLDVDGNRYLDLTGGFGVAAIGHRHPAVVRALRHQGRRLVHGLGDLHAHPARVDLARELSRRAPFPDAQVYFAVSGSDAVEIALKTAVLATGRSGIVAFEHGYHGLTLGALAATGMPRFRRPFAAHLHPRVEWLPWGKPPTLRELPAGALAAVLVEPIQGRGGVRVPPAGWLPTVARFAAQHGALLVLDEILTGGGRTGSFWAVEQEGVAADLVCAGKALGGGLPLGLVLGRRDVLACWPDDAEPLHTGTFVAHPLACAAALAALPVLDDLVAAPQTRAVSALLESGLERLARRFPARVLGVRGRGHLWGLVLQRPGAAVELAARALGHGLILLPAGPEAEVLELLPPLVLTPRQASAALEVLDRCLASSPEDG